MVRKKKKVDTNIIYCGDCKDILKKIPDNSIDLIYLDPPFFSQQYYENFWIKGRGDHDTKMGYSDKDWEKLRGSIDPTILKEYEHIEARWKGGHKGIYVYIAYMRERLEQCERVLKKNGSIYLHCDWHAVHYLKVMMDEIFNYSNFRNEIIWCYSRPSAPNQKQLSRCHDNILWYSKNEEWIFNGDAVRIPYADSSLAREGYGAKASKMAGGVGKIAVVELKEGGKMPEDWWQIPMIKGNSKEWLGYPTQKPEKLLERIIKLSSNKTNIVLDPFCGCGTALAVAKKTGRKFIGIDISRVVCDVTARRLGNDTVKVIGGETKDELKKMYPEFILVKLKNIF